MKRVLVVICEFGDEGFRMTAQINDKPTVLISECDTNMSMDLIWPKVADMCSEYFDTKLRCMGNRVGGDNEEGNKWYDRREP